jgi:aminopeptidase-like protein
MPEVGFDHERLVSTNVGNEIFAFAAEIYPICRSITGDGVRETLERIKAHIPIEVHAVPTGTPVFDWTIPREWNIRDAYIKNGKGEKIVDFFRSNLHVMSYSVPVRARLSLPELRRHLHTVPDQPDVIPYRTSYYSEDWAFCISHRLLEGLREETYEVFIDSTLQDGHLVYGEYLHRGTTDEEFLLSAHVCHPSLANDNCSGIALLTQLAKRMFGLTTRYSYRFLFAPGTIGAITWLARNEELTNRIKHGLVVSMVGDSGEPTYKRSRRGNATIDRAVIHNLRHTATSATVLDFSPYGYDERQFCSPGFNLPVGLLQRSPFGKVPQYHTSADDLSFIAPEHLASSYRLVVDTLGIVEGDLVFRNTMPKCEPQLGRRGLYRAVGGDSKAAEENIAMLWVLNFSDDEHSLLDIADRAGLPFDVIRKAAARLRQHGLLIGSTGEID